MNTLYICGFAAPYAGNFIRSLVALDKTLRGENRKTCILLPIEAQDKKWISDLESLGFIVFYKKSSVLEEYKLIKKICTAYKIELIYQHFWSKLDCQAIKLLKLSDGNIKYVLHHHNEYKKGKTILRSIVKKWLLKSDIQIGCGGGVSQSLMDAGFTRVESVPNCIDFNRLDEWETCSELNEEDGLKLLTFSSYSFEAKGIDISVLACKKLVEKGIKITLNIVTTTDPDEIQRKIENTIGEKLPNWVVLLTPRPDIGSYYHAVDAYVNASRTEGFCYSSLEAVYCGAQVIMSNIPGNCTDIPEAYIFERESVDDLCERIECLLTEDKEALKRRKEEQQKYVSSKYCLDNWVENEIRILLGESLLRAK